MKFFKQIFSTRLATFFVLIVAAISINTWQLVLPNFSYDNSFSIAAAKNIYDGKGYTLSTTSTKDLSTTIYEPLNKWPPGYSLLLVIIKKLTRFDWVISCYILNAIGATLLIFGLRKILLLLGLPIWSVNAYILFAGFFPYPFLSVSFTDLLAVTFFIWAIFFLMSTVVKHQRIFLYSTIASFLLGYCSWLRYMYLSISLIPFLFLLFFALKKNNARLIKSMALGSTMLLCFIIYMLWFQSSHSGSVVYINPTGTGFFPEHLLHVGPLVPASILDFKFYDMQISKALNIQYDKIINFWKLLNVFILFTGLIIMINYYKRKGLHLDTPLGIYVNLTLVISVSIFLLLAGLSLRLGYYHDQGVRFWTYVQEIRYYAVVIIFIQHFILFLIVYGCSLFPKGLNFVKALIIALATIGICHGFYHLSKKLFSGKEIGTNRKTEQIDLLAFETANKLQKQEHNLVIYSYNYELANIASLSGASVLYDSNSLNKKMCTSKPITLLLILNSASLQQYQYFFSIYHPNIILKYRMPFAPDRTTNFYILKIG